MMFPRIAHLTFKELWHGSRSFFFFQAIFTPFILTLVLKLIFGTFFTGKPDLGILDRGASVLTQSALKDTAVNTVVYSDEEALKAAVAAGTRDVGIVLPSGFDSALTRGDSVRLKAYVYGESFLIDRGVLMTAVIGWARLVVPAVSPVDILPVTVGEGGAKPWKHRFIPLVVLLAILMGGLIIPGSSIATEKETHTLSALAITPATLGEVYFAKGLMGFLVSLSTGVMIMALNGAFGGRIVLLLLFLALGGAMAASFGVLIGTYVKTVDTYITLVKMLMLFFYAPGIFLMWPAIPRWVSMCFPTYYILDPVLAIAQRSAGFSDVWPKGLVGLLLCLGLAGLVALRIRNFEGQVS